MNSKLKFSMVMFPFQFIMLGLYAKFASYTPIPKNDKSNYIADHYPLFQDVHVMVVFGVGFLLCYLRKHGYASLTYNLMLVAIVLQWCTIIDPWVTHLIAPSSGSGLEFTVGIKEMINGDFTSAVVLISWCVIIGKTTRLQLFVVALLEPVIYAINKVVVYDCLYVTDAGASITIHFFAAYYGLAMSYVIRNYSDEHDNLTTSYQSDMYCMAGTLFLWIYWPSFNGADLGGLEGEQMRAIVNTYYSLAACVVVTCGLSPLLNKDYKIDMVYIQNASLAGGVAAGMVANMLIQPWGAICLGSIAGVISTLGFAYMTDIMTKYLKIHDTAGTQNLHAFPAVISAIGSIIATATVSPESYPSLQEYASIYPKVNTTANPLGDRTPSDQALYQFYAILVTFGIAVSGGLLNVIFGIAVSGGLLNGIILRFFDHPDEDELFDEEREFEKLPVEDLPSVTEITKTSYNVNSYAKEVELTTEM